MNYTGCFFKSVSIQVTVEKATAMNVLWKYSKKSVYALHHKVPREAAPCNKFWSWWSYLDIYLIGVKNKMKGSGVNIGN